MQILIAIMLYLAVALSPIDATTVHFPFWDRMTTWEKSGPHSWQETTSGSIHGGPIHIEGTTVTFSTEDHVPAVDVAQYIVIPPGLNWDTVATLQQTKSRLGYSEAPILVTRTNNTITISQNGSGGLFDIPFQVTWFTKSTKKPDSSRNPIPAGPT